MSVVLWKKESMKVYVSNIFAEVKFNVFIITLRHGWRLYVLKMQNSEEMSFKKKQLI